MSTPSNCSTRTIIVRDRTLANAIHLNTGTPFTAEQVAAFNDIDGVTGFAMGPDYLAHLGVRGGGSYNVSVHVEQTSTFEALVPQIALVVAGALSVSIDELDVRVENT